MRVIGLRNPSGLWYRNWYYGAREYDPNPDWKQHTQAFAGVLIKNERAVGDERAIEFVRYTVRCDDGKTRKFQVIRRG